VRADFARDNKLLTHLPTYLSFLNSNNYSEILLIDKSKMTKNIHKVLGKINTDIATARHNSLFVFLNFIIKGF